MNTIQSLRSQMLTESGLGKTQRRAMHIRCPQCHNTVELDDEQTLEDLACPGCGSSFSLVAEPTKTHRFQPQQLGHFTLVEQLGTGAHGVVWKAKDSELDRFVAIKVPRADQLSDFEGEKFLREARSAAQLKHPNIVCVHEVGRQDDTLFIVSDFVEGVTLADKLTQGPPQLEETVELVTTIANALHIAHQAGVIHRDLKPSNIMLGADGEPHIMDFGLAKRDGGEITMTVDGQILGTPAYMSPEQASGEAHDCDARSDIYSLGVIMFELLTGERPYRGNTRMLIQQVLHDEAPNPRQLDARIPADIDTICRKCLEKQPTRRYATALELAEELQRFSAGKPIHARPVGSFERAWRFARSNPAVMRAYLAVLFACVAIVVAIATGAGFVVVSSKNDSLQEVNASLQASIDREREARQEAEKARAAALDALNYAREQEAIANQAKAQAEESFQRAVAAQSDADEARIEALHNLELALQQKELAEEANVALAHANEQLDEAIRAFGFAIQDVLRDRDVLVLISGNAAIREYFNSRQFQSFDDVQNAILTDTDFPPGEFEVRAYSLNEEGEPVSEPRLLEKRIEIDD